MPGFDASGPRGRVPGAGWGRGPCGAGLRRVTPRGRRQGFRGRAWGQPPFMKLWGGPPRWGNGPWQVNGLEAARTTGYGSYSEEVAALKAEAARLQEELEAVTRRLVELGYYHN